MIKKAQKAQNTKDKLSIVDQQNEPFLKTIFKRVRNINKKLQEIVDLKKKDDLKPQQIQKINRKAEYEEQRQRLQNIADFFREVYTQNAEYYKNNQLQELDSLAQAVAVLRGNANFKQADKLNDLNKVLSEPTTETLVESTKNISQVLKRFATDYKLKKSLAAFVQSNPIQKVEQVKVQVVKSQPIPESVPAKVEEPQPFEVKPTPIAVACNLYKSEDKTQFVPPQEVVIQLPVSVETFATEQSTQPKGEEVKIRQNKPRGQYRERNNNRGPRTNNGPRVQGQQGQRRRYQPRQGEERKPRPNYRPKQDRRPKVVQDQNDDSDSSLEREPAMRNFKKQEIRNLEDEGFTVVGKPKPKAQDQKQWHQHTHGNKNHHHHHKQNK